MPDLAPPRVRCPRCGGADIVYTCEPRCCFNHVCSACRTTFQTASEAQGGSVAGLARLDPPEDCAPTVPCGECRALAVAALPDGAHACTACGARLLLTYEDVAPA